MYTFLSDFQKYIVAPNDWLIVITDIKNSTGAVAEEKFQEINFIAAGCIVTVLNIVQKHGLEIPYVYGGDGATFLIPPTFALEILGALRTVQKQALEEFKLGLRLGAVPVSAMRSKNYEVLVAKTRIENHDVALFKGQALEEAENCIKKQNMYLVGDEYPYQQVDLSGLECDWRRIAPQRTGDEVVCYLIRSSNMKDHDRIIGECLRELEIIYGDLQTRHPTVHSRRRPGLHYATLMKMLRLAGTSSHRQKMFMQSIISVNYRLHNLMSRVPFIGSLMYKNIPEGFSSDTLKITGTLMTVVSGSKKQRELFAAFLKSKEEFKDLSFGYYAAPAAVTTCYVHEGIEKYIQFVDGYGGGYTKAASMFKSKLN